MQSREGQAVMALASALEDCCGVRVRAATLLDGVNLSTLRLEVDSEDETLAERSQTAQRVVRLLVARSALPAQHWRVACDFPVSLTVGCMPIRLYDRVQVATRDLAVVQALPAQRILSYDQHIATLIGTPILDDAVWSIPFLLQVENVEISRADAAEDALENAFVLVRARWTNWAMQSATMSDDGWRLVEADGSNRGALVALLDGSGAQQTLNASTHKLPPLAPGESAVRVYAYRVAHAQLAYTALAWARTRYVKKSAAEKKWERAGVELWVPITDGRGMPPLPERGSLTLAAGTDWRLAVVRAAETLP